MNHRAFLPRGLLSALTGSAAVVSALGALSAGCGSDGSGSGTGGTTTTSTSSTDTCQDRVSSTIFSGRLSSGSKGRVDLVLAIDNSRAMADKQLLLSLAVPDLVQGLVNPPCIDKTTGEVASVPAGPLSDCPAGTERKFNPVLDLHVGVLSSSLGGHGSDACSTSGAGKQSNNDKAHLLDREDPMSAATVETYQNLGFLAWDPQQMLTPPGEADIQADSAADPNSVALVPQLQDLVKGVGEVGCGYEAQLESWYRFLADPSPPDSVTLDADNKVLLVGIDKVLLDQRKSFLRPDSTLAIVMLTDENDCSIRESGQFYFAAQQKTGNGNPFHLPKARAICDQDPNDECCFSCGQNGPKDDNGNPICAPDPTCKTADGKIVYLDETTDNINLRCFNQKRRFGIDFLYSVDRYVKALESSTVVDRNGQVVPNPIFSDLDQSDTNTTIRSPNQVLLAGLVGVPWQDIARTNANGVPSLLNGIDAKGVARGGFKSADELVQILPGKDYNTWDVILGSPAAYPAAEALPKDPLMIESVEYRTGTNPITGDAVVPPNMPLGNKINGNEHTIPKRDDLQYACVFPLVTVDANGNVQPAVRDCSVPGTASCDCDDPTNDSPLCEVAASGNPTDQVRAKAYPGIRELQVLLGLGSQGVVASVCPAQLDQPQDADFGYRPAMSALTERVGAASKGGCFPHELHPNDKGQVTCVVMEAIRVDDQKVSACNACAANGRMPVDPAHVPMVAELQASNPAFQFNCFCEIPQLSGDQVGEPLWTCQNDPSSDPVAQNGGSMDGYCYVDPAASAGNPEVVANCPDDERRLVRFLGEGQPSPGGTEFITCVEDVPLPPAPGCE